MTRRKKNTSPPNRYSSTVRHLVNSGQWNADFLRLYCGDHKREFWFFADDIFLGTEVITSFDDATAAHHFLVWLHRRREQISREYAARARRASLKLVKGGGNA